TTNRRERSVPRDDRDRTIKRHDDGDEPERMPLFHQPMARPFGLNRQAVKHARLPDREIADVDHLLHFAFAFGENFSGLERHQLPKLVFEFAERVSQTTDGVATDRYRSFSPYLKFFLCARDRCLVYVARSG